MGFIKLSGGHERKGLQKEEQLQEKRRGAGRSKQEKEKEGSRDDVKGVEEKNVKTKKAITKGNDQLQEQSR